MAEGGIFLDILARLNMASVNRVLRDVNTAFKAGGEEAGRSFARGAEGLQTWQAEFRNLTRASEGAFREMQQGLMNLQIQEARINDLRVRNFKRTSDAMIAAQRDFDAALANSVRLMEKQEARRARINRRPAHLGKAESWPP